MKISSSDIVLIRGDEKQAIKGQIWRDKCSGVENIKIVYGTSYSILVPTHVHEQILSARNLSSRSRAHSKSSILP